MSGPEINVEGEGDGRIGKYGRLVIGDEAAAAEAEALEVGVNRYGPLVLGKEVYEEQEAKLKAAYAHREKVVERSEQAQGKRPKPAPVPPPPADLTNVLDNLQKGEEAASDAYVSTKEVAVILEKNPSAFDQILAAELNRAGGPRKGPLRSMLTLEQKREGGARAPVVQAIEAHL